MKTHTIPQYPNKKGATTPPSSFPLNEPIGQSSDNKPTDGKGGSIPHKTRQYTKGGKS